MLKSTDPTDPIVIVGAARTPIGGLLGIFTTLTAPELGAAAIRAAIERSGVAAIDIDEIIMGCVLSAGIGQAPARQAAIAAGIPVSQGSTTLNKMCGSGMKAVMFACDLLQVGTHQIMVAGGMESMTKAPYLLAKARAGYRLGHAEIKDHLLLDGIEDAYEKGKSMGAFAEETAEKYQLSRKIQDEFALHSLTRAKHAAASGWFQTDVEITPVQVNTPKGETLTFQDDELPLVAKPEKIPILKPAFKEGGTVTAANSSSISDGAAALVLMRLSEAKKRNLKPIAKILGYSSFAQEPKWFTTAPIEAIRKLLKKLDWSVEEVDLFEINEAFAVVPLVVMQALNLAIDRVNVHGGACALGHPIGASGARILCTLLGALKTQGKTRGIAAVCIGGGEATAMAVELIKE